VARLVPVMLVISPSPFFSLVAVVSWALAWVIIEVSEESMTART